MIAIATTVYMFGSVLIFNQDGTLNHRDDINVETASMEVCRQGAKDTVEESRSYMSKHQTSRAVVTCFTTKDGSVDVFEVAYDD